MRACPFQIPILIADFHDAALPGEKLSSSVSVSDLEETLGCGHGDCPWPPGNQRGQFQQLLALLEDISPYGMPYIRLEELSRLLSVS